jgi:hypothetical protein
VYAHWAYAIRPPNGLKDTTYIHWGLISPCEIFPNLMVVGPISIYTGACAIR